MAAITASAGSKPPSRRPSLNRLPSVTSLETPAKPFARERNGSPAEGSFSQNASVTLPGLRDVLKIPTLTSEHKLGMSDLLPPSPSPFPPSSRPSISSSAWSSISSDAGASGVRTLPHSNSAASSSTTSLNSLSSQFNQSLTDLRPTGADSASSLSQLHASDALVGPAIRPLDIGPLMFSHDATHAELARTVDELSQWLSVVEAGLTQMLDKTNQDTIEEEQEQEEMVAYDDINGEPVTNSRTDTPNSFLALAAGE
ncbi:hypothetical protein A0H81_11881 [Grifola frondosa]|uniref:Uncharacterized protein n=1 Tax=Grifola frondosa TaxID=5627 RepID=A0A1C7LVR0_GRIFR|nr:hypothetical protein A0H81_11881 [Grifola frondosa]